MNRSNYSLTQLEYVQAVAKYGHFAKAAQACNVTQPTLSMQVQKFEDTLGITIFDRSKKPILLTETGKKLITQIQAILFEAGKIDTIVRSSQTTTLEGQLRVGIIPTIAPYLLPGLLPKLEKSYPGIELRILELQTHRIVDSLNDDSIDVGILATPLKLAQVFESPLYYEVFSVLCRKTHELAQTKRAKYANLKLEDLWLLEEGHCLRHQMLDVCSLKRGKNIQRRYEFESGSLETLKRLIHSYGGYTLLPALAADSIGSNTVLIPFEKPVPAREVGLVYRRERYKRDLIEALEESILESIPEEVRKIRRKDLDVLPIE